MPRDEELRRAFKQWADSASLAVFMGVPVSAPKIDEALPDLSIAERAVWKALHGRRLKSHELRTYAGSADHARALVAKLRGKGRRIETAPGGGYWRPDAPPPEL